MLRRMTLFSLATLVALTGIAITYVFMRGSLENIPQEWSSPKVATCHPTRQTRSGVQKDLWMSNDDGRLHHRMISPRSILTAYPKGENFELVEEMQGMKCYLQENIEEGIQQIRFIESESGTYRYSNQHFDAHQVFLALFRIPGKELETKLDFNSAFLKGVAEDVSLSFSENSPNFHAEKFKAHIRPQKHHD
ncbi:MAG: hypothetical protein KDK59_02585 [Simkania sp.]|nr:hypothetical protein [Simkania sp.]